MDSLEQLVPFNVFLLYVFVRAYFFARREKAVVYARGLLIPSIHYTMVNLGDVFEVPPWLFVTLMSSIPVIIIYVIKGELDVRKGKLKSRTNKDMDFTNYYLELLLVFALSLALSMIFKMNYFGDRFC